MRTLKTWGRSRAVRLDSAYYPPGQAVHVVISAYRRQPVFLQPDLGQMAFDRVVSDPLTIAACLMPDHLHWLLLSDGSFTRQIQRYKQISAYRAQFHGHAGPLWQRSFFDHVLRSEEALDTVAQYILDNPVRAGLMSTEDQTYPYLFVNHGGRPI